MRFSNKVKSGLVVTGVIGALVGVGGTIGYFSARQQTEANTFQTGTLLVDVLQTTPLQVNNWQPGESRQLEFTVKNVGQLPFQAKGKLIAEWSDNTLSDAVIQRTQLERWLGGDWHPVSSDTVTATEEFLISTANTELSLLDLVSNQQEKFRVTLQLSPETGNEYQGQTFTGTVAVVARQTNSGTSWPEFVE